MEMIACTKCGVEKPISRFSRDKQKKNGLYSSCKSCVAEYDREYRQRPGIKRRTAEYMKEYNQRPERREKKLKYSKEYYQKNKERKAEYAKRYNALNKEKIAKRRKVYRDSPEAKRVNLNGALLRKYGITLEERNKIIAEQNNKCVICRRVLNDKNIHVDHNHDTGNLRGILCRFCNSGLGYFFENSGSMRSAADYIEYHQGIGVGRVQEE